MAKKHTINVRNAIASIIGKKMARARLRADYREKFEKIYPQIRYDLNWRETSKQIHGNESGVIIGTVIEALKALPAPKNVLLAGEHVNAKKIYSDILSIPTDIITIAGLDDTSDHQWNFEQNPPALPTYDLVVSYAIFEHLIDPYKHISDLFALTNKNGHIIIYTEMPNFQYHRHPVDCMRFFPDWFYEVAKRHGTTVSDMCISEDHIIVTYTK